VTDPDWDVATVTRDLLRDPLQNGTSTFGDRTGVTNIPDDHVLLGHTEASKGIDYTEEYILIREVGERGVTWRYVDMSGYDADAFAIVEAATPESRGRREEIWTEIFEVASTYRKRRSGLPGAWGTLAFDGAPFNDEAFRWWAMEVGFAYSKRAIPL